MKKLKTYYHNFTHKLKIFNFRRFFRRLVRQLKNILLIPYLLPGFLIIIVTIIATFSIAVIIKTPRAPKLRVGTGDSLYMASNKTFSTSIGNKNGDPQINFSVGLSKASFILSGLNPDQQINPVKKNKSLTFPEVQPNIDLVYTTKPNGLKEELILKQPISQNIFLFDLNLNNAKPKTDLSGHFNNKFYDNADNYLFHFEKPFAIDASGNSTNDVTLEIGEDKTIPGNYYLKLIVDQDWLDDPSRTYPVSIDPTIVHDTTAEFATTGAQFDRVFDTGSGSSPILSSYYQELPTDIHTVGLWHYNESSGNAIDSSGIGNTGTPSGTTIVSGLFGNARSFSGTDSISVTDNSSLDLTTAYTLEAWIYPTTLNDWHSIVNKGNWYDSYGMMIAGAGDKKLRCYTNNTSELDSNYAFAVNSWYHVACVWDGNNKYVYVNGVLDNVGSWTGTLANTATALSVGRDIAGSTYGFIGSIDEVRISNIARSPEEIKLNAQRRPSSVYTSPVIDLTTAPLSWNSFLWTELGVSTGDGETAYSSTSLFAQWNFNETSGTTANNDAEGSSCGGTPSDCDGTLSGFDSTASQDADPDSSWTANNNRWGAGALTFDNTDSYVSIGDIAAIDSATELSSCAWVNHKTTSDDDIIIQKGYDNNPYYDGFVFMRDDVGQTSGRTDTYKIVVWDDDDVPNLSAEIEGASGASKSGVWTHVCFTYQASSATGLHLYVNGKEDPNSPVSTVDVDSIDSGATNLEIGRWGTIGSYFSGTIDATTLFTRVLSSSEILSNYQASNLEFQTRVGADTSPNDGSWEAWKPTTGETAIDDFDNNQVDTRIYEFDIVDHFINQNWQKINNTVESPSNTTGTYGRLPLGVGGSGDDTHIFDSSVIKDGNTYKMWYGGNDGTNNRIYYATSSDGLTWTKYNNTTATNCDTTCEGNGKLGLGSTGTGDDAGVRSPSVIKDGSTYKMWYTGYDGTNNRIYYATSSDGLTWTKYDNSTPSNSDASSTNGRIPMGSSGKGDDAGARTATVTKDGDTYKMWYAGYEGTYLYVYYATSSDGLTWTKYNNTTATACDTICQGSGKLGPGSSGRADDHSIYYLVVIKDADIYKMWYGGYDGGGSNYRLLYAVSLDGLTWVKQDNVIPSTSDTSGYNGNLPLGTGSNADATQTLPQSIIKENGVYKMWYTCCYNTVWRTCAATMNPLPYSQSTETTIKQEGTGSEKFSFGQPQVDANVVGLWHLDETGGTGAYIKDSASTNHSTPTGTTVVDGFSYKARNFNGSSDYIDAGTSLSVTTGTVSMWIYPTARVTSAQGLFAKDSSSNTSGDLFLGIGASNDATNPNKIWYYTQNGSSTFWVYSDSEVELFTWTHISINFGVGGMKMYINGVLQSDTDANTTGLTSASANLYFGTQRVSTNPFTGSLDEVHVSKVARTAEEIAEAYRAGRDHYLDKIISSTDLSAKTSLPFYVASDRVGTFLSATIGESAFANSQPDVNTVGFWHLDEQSGSGAYIKDSSGNNINGTLGVGTSSPEFSQGKIGKARSFNGTSDYIDLGTTTNLNFTTGAFTIEAWIYPTSYKWETFFGTGNGSNGYAFALSNTGTLGLSTYGTTDNGTYTTAILPLNQWSHVAASFSGTAGARTLYINGVQSGYETFTGSITSASNGADIGRRTDGSNYFAGNIDEIRVSNTVRTADQIRQAYEVGARTHNITIDFKAKLVTSYLIDDVNDLSFTVDETAYGSSATANHLFLGDKIIIKENYDGTEYLAQGTVNAVNSSTGVTTVTAWDTGSTFPSGGYTVNATVFKWQREYFDPRGSLSTHRNAITNLTLRLTDGSQGATVWLDDLKSSGGNLTTPGGSTITSSTGSRYLQYRAILSSFDPAVSSTLTAVTLDYENNTAPNTPSLDLPTDTATSQIISPVLKTTATDNDSDYLRYKIELCENVGMSTNCQTFDQTSSQTGWSGQNTQTSTAYTSGTQGVYTLQIALANNFTYYWRSYAIDPGGKNTWSSTQTPYSFTTIPFIATPTACTIEKSPDNTSLTVNWLDNATIENGYRIDRSVDGAAFSTLNGSLSAGTITYLDSPITNGHTYQYRIAAYITGPTYSDWCISPTLDLQSGKYQIDGLQFEGLQLH